MVIIDNGSECRNDNVAFTCWARVLASGLDILGPWLMASGCNGILGISLGEAEWGRRQR